jgi:hypothetical protein
MRACTAVGREAVGCSNKEGFAGSADIGRPGVAKARARDKPAAEGVIIGDL